MQNEYLGRSVGTAGDVNGDGYSDLVVGAPYYDAVSGATSLVDAGKAYVYYGGSAGQGVWTAIGEDQDNSFGWAAAAAGDVNGDGYGDLVVSADRYDNGGSNDVGRVYVYHGRATGLDATPAFTVTGENQLDRFGFQI